MNHFSTGDAAKKLGIHPDTLAHYIEAGKVPPPEIVRVGAKTIHIWTEEKIQQARQLLPKIANGRKTRYKKSAKTKAPARVPVPHKSRKPKKT